MFHPGNLYAINDGAEPEIQKIVGLKVYVGIGIVRNLEIFNMILINYYKIDKSDVYCLQMR